MEFTRPYLPLEWEERWRRDKERRKRMIEEGGEKMQEENRRLSWIKAYNDNRMGVKHSVWQESTHNYRLPEDEGGTARSTDETGSEERKQTYHSATYTQQMFQTLEDFRHSSLLTDLTLSTQNGQSLRAHSIVIAAVSSLIQQKLQTQDAGSSRGEIQVHLGPEVNHLGLAAVLEFAYSGAITTLHRDTAAQIQAAALALGVPRVLDLCEGGGWEDKKDNGNKSKEEEKENRVSASDQQEVSLRAIRQLWVEKVGCDVVLEAEDREFTAHRVVLAASSDYFRGMFSSGMRECQQRSVSVPSLGGEELEPFLHCFYSGALDLSWERVFDLVCSALQFQIQPALSLCLGFLEQEIDATSCLDVASFAEAYAMGDLLELADDYVLRHFQEVSVTPKFQDLPAERLLGYLCCDGLCTPSELTVFRAVVAWLEADLSERLPQARKLMTGVRFPLMTFREFCEVRAVNLRMECSADGEVELHGTALKDFGLGTASSEECFRVRRPKDALVLIGGDQLNPDMGMRLPSRQLWFANALRSGVGLVKDIEWRTLGVIPEQARFQHGAAVMAGKLYVVGGCHFYANNDTMKSGFWMERTAVISVLMSLACMCSGQWSEFSSVNIYSELKELRSLVEELSGRLNATQQELERERADKRVAFTASMLSTKGRNHGPFDRETNLIFEKVLTNVGNAYNTNTGVFTAPVKGLYFFRYSGRASSTKDMGLSIFKGSSRIVSSYDHQSSDTNDSISNGVTLELDVGDVVYMRLWINSWIFVDRRYNYCTFSGFLLFPIG